MNIIELIEKQLDDRFIGAAASETGMDANETRTTARAAIPALLTGLLSALSKPAGPKAFGSLLKDQSLVGSSSSQSAIGSGIGALTSLLGEGKLASLVNAIGGFSGITQNQSRSLIGMLFPLVMGVLGREQRGAPSADGVARLLKSQKREIADAMPASVASSLRTTGMLDALEEEPVPRRTAASAATAASPRPPVKRRGSFWPVAAGLAVLALAVWGITQFTGERPDRREAADASADATQLAAVAPADIDLRVGGVDLRQELTGVVDRASQSLRGVTDAESAQAAVPTLTELNENLDSLMPMVERLPEPARNAFADLARSNYGRLESEIDRIESLPAIPDSVKQVVRELGGNFESFFARGRG